MGKATLVAVLLLWPLSSSGAAETIVIGIDHSFPPFEFVDDEGQPAGFNVDLIRAVADDQGLSYRIVAGPWERILAGLEAGEIDVAPGVVRIPERDAGLDFSAPTALVQHAVFVRKDSGIESIDAARRARVVLQSQSVAHEIVRDRFSDISPATVETAPEVLYGVSEGRHDAGVLLFAQGLYLARTLGIDGVRSMPLDEPFSSAKFRFAVPEGRRQLLAKLNDGLQNVRLDGSYDALYDEWLGAFKQESFLSTEQARESVTVVLALAGFLAVALLWLWSLRREVEARTRELARRGEEKLELQRELLQSQKMEALGRLASGVAHDFNNLLTTIMGSTALAQNDVDPESGMGRILARVENASRSGAQLTRQLLTFSRRQAIEPRNVSWNDVVQSSREMLERLLGRRISVHYEPVEDLWMVRIDPGQALQIVMNLLINARDAISGAGQIWISAHNEERAEGEFVRLSVRDDGFGMDVETRRKIFEPFFTTKEHGRGTGLGMSTIHGIAEQHGGRVEVESQPGEGSTFHVDLPRSTESTESTEPDEPSETTHKRVDSPKERILFVEDEPNARATGAALIRELGHDVLEARSGETALALLRENPDVSTLITDVGLPGMSGVSLARQIATEGYAVRVLFCSGDPEALEFLDSHAVEVGFIEKPYTMESLAEALAQAPARHTPGPD